jgi:transcription antitermination factor NusG
MVSAQGQVDWYCLLIVPQREDLAKTILESMGFTLSLPIEYKFIKRGSKSVPKAYPLLGPRYLFIEAPDGYPWKARWGCHLVSGVVTVEGRPAVFHCNIIKKLARITAAPYNIPISTVVHHKSLRVGEAVILKSGPFGGHSARVVEVERGRVLVFVSLLGSAQAVEHE